MLIFSNWRVWAAGAVLALLAWSHWTVYHLGRDRVQAAWDRDRAETAMQSIIATERVLTDHDAITKRLRAQNAAAAAGRDAALQRLRDISAADILPGDPAPQCADQHQRDTELFRAAVARALAIGADADIDRRALIACRAEYESLRKAAP